MLMGTFAEAWRESDSIAARGKPDAHRLWRGEPLDGKRVILRCLHGFGDAVQFLRYAPRLRAMAQSLTVEVNPRFLELASNFAGVEEVITWGDAAPAKAPEWDVQIEIMELPYLFRTQLGELPLAIRYLRLLSRPAEHTGWNHAEPKPLRVGLVWTAGRWNSARSIPFSTLHALLEVPGCEFWDLESAEANAENANAGNLASLRQDAAGRGSERKHYGSCREDRAHGPGGHGGHPGGAPAGAMGVPCWVLLQHAADWRWMHERDDSPWYPTLRLFRQPAPGDWAGAIAKAHGLLLEQVVVQRDMVCPG